jgi:amino acid permease
MIVRDGSGLHHKTEQRLGPEAFVAVDSGCRIELGMTLGVQVVWLFVLAIPIACVAWTVTHEEIFREPREYCEEQSSRAQTILRRKFFYVWTCEYCFSHYVAVVFLIITRYKLLFDDWRGYFLAFFALPFISNFYMGLYAQTKLEAKKDRYQSHIAKNQAEITRIEAERSRRDKEAA